MAELKFRKAAIEDVPDLIKLLKETILEVYGQILPRDRLMPWIEGDRLRSDVNLLWQKMIVAEKEGELVAVAAALEDKVALLWVHPDHQRNGIGGALLDIVEADLARSGHETAKLECFSDNDRALGFYRARSWNVLCQEMDEYAGAMKMVMTKTLKKDFSQV